MKFLCLLVFFSVGHFYSIGQNVEKYFDSSYNLHFSFPEKGVKHNLAPIIPGSYRGDQIFAMHYPLSGSEEILIYVSYFSYDNYKKSGPLDEEFYKVFTIKKKQDTKIYKSDSFRSKQVYVVDSFYHKAVIDSFFQDEDYSYKELTAKVIKNNDVFAFRFRCPPNRFDQYRQVFLNIANSIYFD